MGTLEQNTTTSPGVCTFKTEKTFRFFPKVFHILLWEKRYIYIPRLFSVGYVGTSLKETREELVILATQRKHLCAEKINTKYIATYGECTWNLHILPDHGKVVPPCFRLSYVTKSCLDIILWLDSCPYLYLNSAPPPTKEKTISPEK